MKFCHNKQKGYENINCNDVAGKKSSGKWIKTGKDTHRKPKRRNFVIGLKIADKTTPPSGSGFKTCINYANELENEARVQNQFREHNARIFTERKFRIITTVVGRFRVTRW